MITVEKSIVIDRRQEDLFEYVSDHTNAPRWQRGLLEVRRATEGPIGVGTRHTLVRMFMGVGWRPATSSRSTSPIGWSPSR